MIRLDSTTRKLEVILAGAKTTVDAKVTVSYYDVPAQTKNDFSEYRGVTQVATTNGAADVTICNAPTGNAVRNVDTIQVHNADTANITATVKMDDGGTETPLVKQTLTTGQTLMYEHGSGWKIL